MPDAALTSELFRALGNLNRKLMLYQAGTKNTNPCSFDSSAVGNTVSCSDATWHAAK